MEELLSSLEPASVAHAALEKRTNNAKHTKNATLKRAIRVFKIHTSRPKS